VRFLFVDAVELFEPHARLVGRVTFPRTATYPVTRPDGGPSPALLLEALAQAGGWLANASHDFTRIALMSLVRGFRQPQPVPPAAVLAVAVETSRRDEVSYTVSGTLTAGGELVAAVDSILYVLTRITPETRAWCEAHFATLSRRPKQPGQDGGDREGV
jgi:3-hydroxyacyl-[acyl-carrier-protein] dehydratase